MLSYPAGTTVTVTIPYQDANELALQPSAVTYQVLDELENQVVAPTALPVQLADIAATITIQPAANTLPAPGPLESEGPDVGVPQVSTSGLRSVVVTMTTPVGAVVTTLRYILLPNSQLNLLQNTFQPFNQAVLIAYTMENLNGWTLPTTTDQQRINALAEAYNRLIRFGYFVRWPRDPDAQNYISWMDGENEVITPRLWPVMSLSRWFNLYPEEFRSAMRHAQVAEADNILANDPITNKRQLGIMMEKTGESQMQFRGHKPLDLGISVATLRYLKGYIDLRISLTRAP